MPDLGDVARRLAARTARTRVGQRLRRPRLSVIVPFYNVEKYLAECLDSILAQDFRDIEVLLVDDGSPDGSRRIAERYVARDQRVRLLTRPNGGLGAARNTGVRAARGSYLTFVVSDDRLPAGALRVLMAQASRSGSEIVMGAVERFDSRRRWRPTWLPAVHTHPRTAVTLDEFLPLLRNLYTWNKVFRRDFWERQGLWFREGVAYEDQPIITQLFARATSIDVIPDVVYEYRARDDKSSISQQTASLKDLRARIEAWRLSEESFRKELSPQGYQGWLATLFNAHFHWYLASAGTIDDTYWEELTAAVRHYSAQAEPWVWEATEPAQRVLVELARQDRRADAQELVRRQHTKASLWPAEVRDDGILLQMPFHDDPALPTDLFLLRPEQMTVEHSVENIRWIEDGGRVWGELTGSAFILKVDLARFSAQISLILRNVRSGVEFVHSATQSPRASTPLAMDDLWCDYSAGTFRIRFPVEELVEHSEEGDQWEVCLQVVAAGFTATTPVTRVLRSGAAGRVPGGLLGDGRRVRAEWRFGQALRFVLDSNCVEVHGLGVGGRRLSGTLAAGHRIARVEAVSGGARVTARVADDHFALELPPVPPPAPGEGREWQIRVAGEGGQRLVVAPSDVPRPRADQHLVVQTNRSRELIVIESTARALAESATTTPTGELVIDGLALGSLDRFRLRAVRFDMECIGAPAEVREGEFRAVLDLRHEFYRFGRQPLAAGSYDLFVDLLDGSDLSFPLQIGPRLRSDLPVRVDTHDHEGNLLRGPTGAVQLRLARPLGDVRGKYAQNKLRSRRSTTSGLTRGILFRSYFGERATDNGLSIQEALRRRGSDLPVYWAVQDYGVPVPEGSTPVLVNSREWYDLLGSVKYYVDNMYQPEYFQKREGQVLVQTFHGYPFKVMGHTHWRHQQFSQAKIDAYDARAAEWDYLVSPARYATPLLRREFNFHGEVLEIGYPRNDVLFSSERDALRHRVRESLGIRPDQTVVLYAPTFRDYLAEDDQSAVMVDFFDFEEAQRGLGDDYVLLIRGHAFNARTRLRHGSRGNSIDVTVYPEVSDLYLAADAAVVDYSSLRFDFGVTGKPMIFHVPDLERYKAARGWLFDFELTAPGPLARTTEEVVGQLRDLDGVQARHRSDYEVFRADYLDLEDGKAGERFVDAVIVPRGDA